MNPGTAYVAFIRLKDDRSPMGISRAVKALGEVLGGAGSVDLQPTEPGVLVWFDRRRVSLGDLVRTIEDAGVGVASVAQHRAAGPRAGLATA